MDILQELARSLNNRERKLFIKYLKYKSNKNERLDLLLFNYLLSNDSLSTAQIVKFLYSNYSKKNANAYHFLRKCLKDILESFILQQKTIGSNQTQISRLTNLAQNLYYNKKYKPAWHYLKTAENIAVKAEEYELLNQIYQQMIEYAWTQPAHILNEIIKKEKANRTQAQTTRSMNLALSVIHNKLKAYHQKGEKANIQNIIKESLKEFNVERVVAEKASERFKLVMLVKVSLEEDNNYIELYKYIINTLHEMEKAKMFTKYNYRNRIDLLNIVSYTASRAGDYETAEKYIQIIEEENKIYPETDLLSIQSFMTKAVCYGLKGQIPEVLQVLEYLQNKYKNLYKDDDYFFISLNKNLTAAYFHLCDIKKSRKSINELLNHSRRVMRHFGLEDLFYCHTIECILAIEDDDFNYALSRIQAIERKYSELLKLSHNNRNNEFIKILRTIIINEQVWKLEKFRKTVNQFIQIQPLYKPGFEFVSFNAWLYSKLENVPYSESEYNRAIIKTKTQS